MDTKSALPPWLDKGSSGPAVAIVQAALAGARLFEKPPKWGIYDEITEAAVLRLQEEGGINRDGNYGKDTRDLFKRLTGIDLNEIPMSALEGPTAYYGPDSPEACLWGE